MSPRRLTSLLVLWFALFSIAAPAITCAAAAERAPCCPAEGTPPCGECPEPAAAGVSAIHCVTGSAMAVVQSVASQEQDGRLAQPNLDAAPALPPTPADGMEPSWSPAFEPHWRPPDRHAPPPYLLTGRLRL